MSAQRLTITPPPQNIHYSGSKEDVQVIVTGLKTNFPRDWDSRILIIPSDCSYESPDLCVYNQHTELWGSRALHYFEKQNKCFLNQTPLDKVEKADGPDPVRGTIKASYGYCSDMSTSRTDDEADMGLAAPNITQNNGDNNPQETYGTFSRLCEHLQVGWAVYDDIVADEKRKLILERFSRNPKLCPVHLNNKVTAFTHARIPLFEATNKAAEVGIPPTIVDRSLWGLDEPIHEAETFGPDFWETTDPNNETGNTLPMDHVPPGDYWDSGSGENKPLSGMLEEEYPCPSGTVVQLFAPVLGNGNTMKAHVDSHNTQGSAVVCWSLMVRHNKVLYRDSFIMYDRKSLWNFASHHIKYRDHISKVRDYVSSLPHPSLGLRDLAGYQEVMGNKGVVFVVESKSGTLRSIAAKTTPALNKPAAFISAFGSAIRKLHDRRPLTLFQHLTLIRIASSCNKVLPFVTILGHWEDVGLPGDNLLPSYEALATEFFGGHNIGPCQRHSPHHTGAWEKQTLASSLAILGDVIEKAQLAQTRHSRNRDNAVKSMLPKELQDCAEKIMAQICMIKGIKDLSAQVAFGLILQLGLIPNAKMSEHTTHSSASAMFKGKNLTDEEMSKVVKAVAYILGITTAMAENGGCEGNRRSDVVDLAPANSFFIGNPCPDISGGHQMQSMDLRTGIWEALAAITPRDNGKHLLVDIEEHVTKNKEMPDLLPIRVDGGKARALENYYVVELPPEKGNSTYDGLIEAIAKRCLSETNAQTMDRVQAHLEVHLGCPLSNKIDTVAAGKPPPSPRGRGAQGKQREGRPAKKQGTPLPPVVALAVLAGEESSTGAGLPTKTDKHTSKEEFVNQSLTGVPSGAFRQDLSAGESLLELVGQVESMLRQSGVLKRSPGTGLTKKRIVTMMSSGKLGNGDSRAGYYSTLPIANLNFSDSGTSVVGTSISVDLFGGFKVLDENTLTPRILFPNKQAATKCLLFLAVMLQGRLCPEFAVSFVTRLFQKRDAPALWKEGCLRTTKLRLQGLPGCYGYLVMKDTTCWYAYEAGHNNPVTHQQTKPLLKFFKFVVNESGHTKRTSPRNQQTKESGRKRVTFEITLHDPNKKTKAGTSD